MKCTIAIQPYYPRRAITEPVALKNAVQYSYGDDRLQFPDYNPRPIPEGVLHFFRENDDRYTDCHQVYAQGLLFRKFTPAEYDSNIYKVIVPIGVLITYLFVMFQTAKRFFSLFGYIGVLEVRISLDNCKGIWFGAFNKDDLKPCLLENYCWRENFDTNVLNDTEELKQFFCSLAKKIFWDAGFSEINDNVILQKFRW